MKRKIGMGAALLSVLMLPGCSGVGDKAMGMSVIYAVVAVLSLLLLVGYCTLIRRRQLWLVVLFTSVFVVNVGYWLLSVSTTLDAALWANRLAYLGSVFLPLSMLMVILNVSKLPYPKWLAGVLLGVSAIMFLVAGSPGILDIYYKEVTLVFVDGVAVLQKVYGPLHSLYFYFLILYFAAIIALAVYVIAKKRLDNGSKIVVLVVAVSVNIGVWLVEQLVKIDFEFLSISYIISELFLLGLSLMVQETERLLAEAAAARESAPKTAPLTEEMKNSQKYLFEQLPRLTYTERMIYDLYLEGKSTKEVLLQMNIKENTLKYHNKNIYGKLGVSSRKELLMLARSREEA